MTVSIQSLWNNHKALEEMILNKENTEDISTRTGISVDTVERIRTGKVILERDLGLEQEPGAEA
jgi:uncharacterized protein YerC